MLDRMWIRDSTPPLLVRVQTFVTPQLQTVVISVAVPQKMEIDLLQDLGILLLDI